VKTITEKVARHSVAYLPVQKWLVVDVPIYLKFWPKLTRPLKNAEFQSFSLIAPQP